MAMSVMMICPNLNCRRTVVVADTARGKVVRCSHCKQAFMVPELKSRPAAQNQEEQGNPKSEKKSSSP